MAEIEHNENPILEEEEGTILEDETVTGDGIVDETISTVTNTVEEDETEVETEEEEEKEVETRECKGLFARLPVTEFTQNEKYSDRYLKSKGLFKEQE